MAKILTAYEIGGLMERVMMVFDTEGEIDRSVAKHYLHKIAENDQAMRQHQSEVTTKIDAVSAEVDRLKERLGAMRQKRRSMLSQVLAEVEETMEAIKGATKDTKQAIALQHLRGVCTMIRKVLNVMDGD